jgi:hypothetical protein
MRKYRSPKPGVPFEVLQKKHGVGPKLHLFLEAEFFELEVFGNAELEWNQKQKRSSPKHPLRMADLEND